MAENIENIDENRPSSKEEKEKIKEEKRRHKQELKELKRQKKEAEELEGEDEAGGGFLSTFMIIFFIILIWLALFALFIKLDIGGFGSGVAAPILKDVPVLNAILPGDKEVETDETKELKERYYGYSNLDDAVSRIKELELEVSQLQSEKNEDSVDVDALQAEIKRLKTFEDTQVEFEKIRNQFYDEVVFSEKAPDIEEYKKYYESIDPANAEVIYRDVVGVVEYNKEIEDYAAAYSAMKPKAAAKIFEAMTNDLQLAAKILHQMGADDRGNILGAMDATVAAQITAIMEPMEYQ